MAPVCTCGALCPDRPLKRLAPLNHTARRTRTPSPRRVCSKFASAPFRRVRSQSSLSNARRGASTGHTAAAFSGQEGGGGIMQCCWLRRLRCPLPLPPPCCGLPPGRGAARRCRCCVSCCWLHVLAPPSQSLRAPRGLGNEDKHSDRTKRSVCWCVWETKMVPACAARRLEPRRRACCAPSNLAVPTGLRPRHSCPGKEETAP